MPLSVDADEVDKTARDLNQIQAEVTRLKQGLRQPNFGKVRSSDQARRRLIDAQVAFGVGHYDRAAIVLYDYVERYPNTPDFDKALYYLAESLFQKKDHVAARTYFRRLVDSIGSRSSFYQQSLERLIELSMSVRDQDTNKWLQAIDQIPEASRIQSLFYTRAKVSYNSGDYSNALRQFARITSDSKYYMQARYFLGTTYVALGKLKQAQAIYEGITAIKPKGPTQTRIVELSHMALGRLNYELNRPSKAINEYLSISRKSDMFDEALFEVAWVYVKNKEFDKALRALELLSLNDSASSTVPQVGVLEGNLRIRRAQTIAETGKGNSVEEYDKALAVFEKARKIFRKPYIEIGRLLKDRRSAREYVAHVTGRNSETFRVERKLPEIAAVWLREEGDVAHVVQIETDLGAIEKEIDITTKVINRMEQILNTNAGVNAFPGLAKKRVRGTELSDQLVTIRQKLTTRELALVRKYATPEELSQLSTLTQRRENHARTLRTLPYGDVAEGRRIEESRASYTRLDNEASKIGVIVETTDQTLQALETYLATNDPQKQKQDEGFRNEVTSIKQELDAMRAELSTVRQQMVLARDATGAGDEVATRARTVRGNLRAALEEEHQFAMRIIQRMSGNDRNQAQRIASLLQQASRITLQVDDVDATIVGLVERGLRDVRTAVDEEKARLAAYKKEFKTYEAESRRLGGDVLAKSFSAVRNRFYDILVRADIGIIDVTWSRKEIADEASQRLVLDQQRELRTLHEEFDDVLSENTPGDDRDEKKEDSSSDDGDQ